MVVTRGPNQVRILLHWVQPYLKYNLCSKELSVYIPKSFTDWNTNYRDCPVHYLKFSSWVNVAPLLMVHSNTTQQVSKESVEEYLIQLKLQRKFRPCLYIQRCNCTSSAVPLQHMVKTLYADGGEISCCHKNTTSVSSRIYVGGRSSPEHSAHEYLSLRGVGFFSIPERHKLYW